MMNHATLTMGRKFNPNLTPLIQWSVPYCCKPLPAVSKAKRGQHTVRPSALECAKLGVYQAMTEQGIKKAELARRLGWHMPQVDRLFDLRHASKLDQIEAAAKVLGRQIEVRIA